MFFKRLEVKCGQVLERQSRIETKHWEAPPSLMSLTPVLLNVSYRCLVARGKAGLLQTDRQSSCSSSTVTPNPPTHWHHGYGLRQGGGEGPALQLQRDGEGKQVHHPDVREHHQWVSAACHHPPFRQDYGVEGDTITNCRLEHRGHNMTNCRLWNRENITWHELKTVRT